ncbi:GNAT family N-acetyltransferase [Roseateles oligotrophus]|uniref:GNAT family N-acetyltransferase n=1 Tax=Roseateles oligotrophus TaxID=1769250 RepID=A0ABT2YD51_9BURK|nr:GNAT family N-acetyltransferase [Roseateles oligotrophus]MCV2367959.1 GNAT family N-acetyltransferase [Roseateles oligotrophus]
MRPIDLPCPPDLRCMELEPEDIPALQRFFDSNPEYFLAVGGEPAGPNLAEEEFHELPPAELKYNRTYYLAFVPHAGSAPWRAIAQLTSDLMAEGVFHIGLFIVATANHGQGDAQALLASIERWAGAQGARWLRLGVVVGNARAERFWAAQGFVELRQRHGVATGPRLNSIRVMLKPLAGTTQAEYLALVARDRPDC